MEQSGKGMKPPSVKTKNVIMCCMVRAISQIGVAGINEYTATVEW